MFDTDKFILTIEGNPPIWDKSIKEYSDRNEKEKCWLNVGAEMFANWEEMTDAEKQSQVKDLKSKWRHIRDNFAKCTNQGKSGDPAIKKRKYFYADALNFLLQPMAKRTTSGNIGEEVETQEKEDADTEDPEKGRTSAANRPPLEAFQKPPVKHVQMTAFQKKILDKLEKTDGNTDDPDTAFLLSMLPDVKKLDYDENLDFRCHVLQFFRDRRNKRTILQSLTQPSTSFQQPPSFHQHSSTFFPQYQVPYQQLNTRQSPTVRPIFPSHPQDSSSASSPPESLILYSDSSTFPDV